MKYQIPQSRLNLVIDKIVRSIYGEELKMFVQSDGYIFFHYGDYDVESKGFHKTYTPFHRNLGKNLWVGDLTLPKKISSLMSVSKEGSFDILKNYFSTKYNIPVIYVSDESYEEWD